MQDASGSASNTPKSCRSARYVFKQASTKVEIDQVHRLNHRTFVDEVGHSEGSTDGRLVDKFHDKNTYFVALEGSEVVGMVAVHDQPPFSTTTRLADPGALESLGDALLEIRLLAVRPDVRLGMVVPGLVLAIHDHVRRRSYTHLLISGLRCRVPLYEKMGFRALGPAVSSSVGLEFVPMALDFGQIGASAVRTLDRWRTRLGRRTDDYRPNSISLLPGPVEVGEPVREALAKPPRSHRSTGFIDQFERTRERLGAIVERARGEVALFAGSGTLANDMVAATLADDLNLGPGLILANGEFGDRITRQAARFGLNFQVFRWPWGHPWNLEEVATALAQDRSIGWVWGVHLESSTGMLNDLKGLVDLCRGSKVRICLDCVSSLGATPLDLTEVDLASASSGKSLGAFGGLAIVFASPGFTERPSIGRPPISLDLREALTTHGPRFTLPSPLLEALDQALNAYETPRKRRERYDQYARLGQRVRRGLADLGIRPITDESQASPVLTTFTPPESWTTTEFRAGCQELGFEIAADSDYLKERGWLQIATMGAVTIDDCETLFLGLAKRIHLSSEN